MHWFFGIAATLQALAVGLAHLVARHLRQESQQRLPLAEGLGRRRAAEKRSPHVLQKITRVELGAQSSRQALSDDPQEVAAVLVKECTCRVFGAFLNLLQKLLEFLVFGGHGHQTTTAGSLYCRRYSNLETSMLARKKCEFPLKYS